MVLHVMDIKYKQKKGCYSSSVFKVTTQTTSTENEIFYKKMEGKKWICVGQNRFFSFYSSEAYSFPNRLLNR